MLNALTVDVEDYYNQLAIDFCDRIEPPRPQSEVDTHRMLDLFAEFRVRTTCFILGEMAEHFPSLVRRIADEGHQLGVHAYYHHQVWRHTPAQFREITGRAIKTIEDVAGRTVDAHRAVAFSIVKETLWALPILADLGIVYDSSIFPFKGRRYGIATSARGPHRIELPDGRSLWEFPLSTVDAFGRRWPVCGGGYLRHFPLTYSRSGIRRLHAEGLPANLYLHPYEIEVAPRIAPIDGLTSWRQRLKFRFFNFHQLRRRAETLPKLRALLSEFRFGPIDDVLREWTASLAPASGASPPSIPRVRLAQIA
ncbi:MAG: polysaccharide deacetylase family protein [Phycisphaerae bacterium]|nr:polysaccharide deacetylase family protein [Phycisphaerae bacterium]